MNVTSLYAILLGLTALLALFVIVYFLRYRFRGDQTLLIIVLFIVSFLVDVSLTLSLFDPRFLTP